MIWDYQNTSLRKSQYEKKMNAFPLALNELKRILQQ